MNLSATEGELPSTAAAAAKEVHISAEIDWEMLDKLKFFFLGATLFSSVSGMLYPIVVLKTRQQVAQSKVSCIRTAFWIVRNEGFRALYRGFGTSLTGTIPARALYMTALEITKSNVGSATVRLGFPEPTATTIANAATGLSATMAAQLVWTPIEIVKFLLLVSKVKEGANSLNWMGFTALDVLEHSPKDFKRFTLQNILMDAGVERANNQNNLPPPSATMIGHHESGKPTQLSKQRSSQFLYLKHKGHWIKEMRSALMVVATVIATITYQLALSPPNGVWLTQACLNTTCEARTLVLGSHVNYHNLFLSFLVSNSIAFTASLRVIFLLISGFHLKNKFFMVILTLAMCTTLTFLGNTYVLSFILMIPEKVRNELVELTLLPISALVSLILLVLLIYIILFLISLLRMIFKFILRCAKALIC